MAEYNISVVPTGSLALALPINSQSNTPTSYLLPTLTEPAEATSSSLEYGQSASYAEGKLGLYSCQRLLVLPFCDGAPGSRFWTRLYGWRTFQGGKQSPRLWIPMLLAQFLCVSGDLPGMQPVSGTQPQGGGQIPPSPPNALMAVTENFCQVLALVSGSVGQSGEIVNAGGFISYAMVELRGAEKFQFEFQTPDDRPVSMNALWARA